MEFHLGYNQRAFPHSNAIYGDVGPRWRYDWVSYVTDNNTLITAPYYYTLVTLRGGGSEQYDNATSIERTHWKSRARFQQMSFDPPRYERRLADGTVEIYELADRAASLPSRNIYLTQLIDPQGQTLTFTYDAQFRLVAVTDAVGQVTTLDYQDPSDPMLLTKVTDPFGRFAAMTYNAAGQLASITDAIGMTSRFAYGPADFVQAMTTPYGTTTFKTDEFIGAGVWQRSAEVTDPEGGRERIEYHISNAALSPTVPAGDVPAGFADLNNTMDKYTTLYWNKQAMAEAPGDLAHAVITRWLLGSDSPYAVHAVLRNVPHSIKRPLESRIWYRYPNQLSSVSLGQGEQPSQIARVLDDGSTQLTQFTYNDRGNVTSYTDPIGRQTTLTYDTNLIDVLEVRQTKSGGSDLLVSLSGYGTVHRPTSIVDAAGQGKTIVYNTAGQPLTVTNAKSEITTFAYDAGATGYLTSVTGPITGATVSYTYDPVGRVQSVTQPDGYAVGSAYDALNRVTLQTYPDGTSESFIYDKLNLIESRQRAGRVTRYFYDRAGRLTATRDPLGRIIRQEWCGCGQLAALVDGNGNRTSWTRDSRGRITTETRADGAQTTYVYDGTGRVRTVTDPKGQIATYMYAADDRVTGVTYSNTTVATSGVTFTFDPVYPRVTTMIDGTGTTVYTYRAAGTLGAGQVASVDGPLADDTMTYAYDELGRVISRAINGSANTVTWSFDPLGRVTSEVNVLGTFGYTYDGQTVRLATATYPNGQTSSYTYLPTNQNARLQTIHHKYPNGLTLSKFDYSYDAVGNIVTWRQQADAAAVQWTYGYDAVDQLTQAVKLTTDSTPVVLRRFAYSYDAAGNRVSEQIDDALTSATYNDRNELVSQQPSGGLTFVGAVNEPAAVFVDTHPMAVATNNSFRGTAAVSPGTSVVTVAATDPSGNTTSKNYQVSLSGASQTLTYDANGNLISDGSRLFEWDAENRLTAVTLGTSRSEFSYDGLSRRSRVLERANGLTIRDAKLIWSGKDIVEERLSTGELNRFYTGGESFNGLAGFLTVDHLRSSREITDSNGTVTIRNDYDPFGRLTRIIGTQDTRFSFGGFFNDQGAHISSAVYRAYDPEVGRWLSEDPIGLAGGINRFRYSANAVTKLVDPSGLNPKDPYYDPKYKDPGFRDYLERAKRDWGIPKGGQADRDEMEDIYNTWVSEGRPGRSKENKGREQKPPEPSQEQNDSGWEVPWWVPPAVVGGIVGLICILQPEACLPAAGAGLKMCPAR